MESGTYPVRLRVPAAKPAKLPRCAPLHSVPHDLRAPSTMPLSEKKVYIITASLMHRYCMVQTMQIHPGGDRYQHQTRDVLAPQKRPVFIFVPRNLSLEP